MTSDLATNATVKAIELKINEGLLYALKSSIYDAFKLYIEINRPNKPGCFYIFSNASLMSDGGFCAASGDAKTNAKLKWLSTHPHISADFWRSKHLENHSIEHYSKENFPIVVAKLKADYDIDVTLEEHTVEYRRWFKKKTLMFRVYKIAWL